MGDVLSDAARRLSQQAARRIEYEIRGAWRAEYDYVHVYRAPSGVSSPGGVARFKIRKPLVRPSQSAEHASSIGEYQYVYSYDLTSISETGTVEAVRYA